MSVNVIVMLALGPVYTSPWATACCLKIKWSKLPVKVDFGFNCHWRYLYVCSISHDSKLRPTRCNVCWFIYFYRRSTCFGRFLRLSSGAHNCTYSLRYCQPILLLAGVVDEMGRGFNSSTTPASSSIGWQYLKLYVQVCAPDDMRRNRPKHVEVL
jgi:hypothetical protein